MYLPYTHCTYCGAAFLETIEWPRTCVNCGNVSFRNPLPVSVVLVPVEDRPGAAGVIAVRRGIPPRMGELALPGGYINYGETWQEAGAREVFEETGLIIHPDEITELRVRSAPDGTLIIFGAAPLRPLADLPPFAPNAETGERVILTGPVPMAFQLHEEIVQDYFRSFLRG